MRPWLRHSFFLIASFGSLADRAGAIEIDFTVTDKLGKPIQGARICLEDDGGQCTETNAEGKSAYSGAVSNRSVTPAGGFSVSYRRGGLSVASPSAVAARFAGFDARGKSLGPERVVDLKAGNNRIEMPFSAGGKEGLIFFRLTAPGVAFTGKALSLASGAGEASRGPAESPRMGALGKVAAANLYPVIISKSGYQSITYRPRTERDTGIVVRMPAIGDSGFRYAGIIRAKVTAIDTAKRSLTYTYMDKGCNGSTLMSVEKSSTLPLYIKDGNWYFAAGNCKGVVLTKEGPGFYGLWKTVGVRNLPPGLFPVTCEPSRDSVVTGILNLFFIPEGGGWDIDLREDSMTITLNRVLCPGNQAIYKIEYYDGLEGRPLLARNTCREVEFRNAAAEPGIYSFVTQADSLRGVFTYKDKTCPTPAVSLLYDSNGPKLCPETQPTAMTADTTFQRCTRESGFIPPAP
jgi:hypothetical protein